jgi:hypothetical protein
MPKVTRMTVLDREPIDIVKIFSPADYERLRREITEEGEEVRTILACLERLRSNPRYTNDRILTAVECWYRSYEHLRLEMDATWDDRKKDLLIAMLVERQKAWGKIQEQAKRALAQMDRRNA